MALLEINAAKDELMDVASELEAIDYELPDEPSDNASQDEWRDWALHLCLVIERAERVTVKAAAAILN
jgi:hypothetical protein